jgi:hypothetical protein
MCEKIRTIVHHRTTGKFRHLVVYCGDISSRFIAQGPTKPWAA